MRRRPAKHAGAPVPGSGRQRAGLPVSATTITFTDVDTDRTEIRIHPATRADALRGPDAENGFQSSLDRFERYLHTADRKDIRWICTH